MGFILPLLAGHVRDSRWYLIGGSAIPIHCLCITLPHAVSLDQYGDSSPPFGEAREAVSRSSEESFSIQKNTRDRQNVACCHASLVPSLHRSREGIQRHTPRLDLTCTSNSRGISVLLWEYSSDFPLNSPDMMSIT